jgi:hypothetical protein
VCELSCCYEYCEEKKVNERLKTFRPELELSRGIYLCLSSGVSCEIIGVPGSGLLGHVWRRKAHD